MTSLVSSSRAEVVECPGHNPYWSIAGSKCVLTVVSMRASITFAAGQSSEIGRYEVPREEFLPGLGIWITIDDFQIAGIRHNVTEPLKSVVRYSIALVQGSLGEIYTSLQTVSSIVFLDQSQFAAVKLTHYSSKPQRTSDSLPSLLKVERTHINLHQHMVFDLVLEPTVTWTMSN